MIPIAAFADKATVHDEHHAMELAMTPAVPMSTVHCEGCVIIKQSPPMNHMHCESGHCFSQAIEGTAIVFSFSKMLAILGVFVVYAFILTTFTEKQTAYALADLHRPRRIPLRL